MPVGTIRVDLPFIYRTQKVGRAMRNGWGRAMRQFGSVMGARYESGACAREAHVSGEAESRDRVQCATNIIHDIIQ